MVPKAKFDLKVVLPWRNLNESFAEFNWNLIRLYGAVEYEFDSGEYPLAEFIKKIVEL